jgi:hypothetical protein
VGDDNRLLMGDGRSLPNLFGIGPGQQPVALSERHRRGDLPRHPGSRTRGASRYRGLTLEPCCVSAMLHGIPITDSGRRFGTPKPSAAQ